MLKRRLAATVVALALTTAPTLAATGPAWAGPALAGTGQDVVVRSGQTWVVPATTRLRSLTVESGASVVAPAGHSLSLTVGGVETGQKLVSTGGAVTQLVAGTYRGDVVLTVAAENPIAWQTLTFPFRQALYVGASGVDDTKSVRSAVTGGTVTSTGADGVSIASTGEAFDGVYAAGSYDVSRSTIRLNGDGRSDFVGYGSAIVGTGTSTRLVLDHVKIDNKGAVRTGVVADGGSNVIVKDSSIATHNAPLPADYQGTVDLTYMEAVPWMLGINPDDDVRATNLLGVGTKATYLHSSIYSQGWGVLSTDSGQNGHLTAVGSTIGTGAEGYGSYAIGNATEEFLGDTFHVGTYASINRGGAIHYGDSTRAAVSALNGSLGLGLSARDLNALPVRNTVIDSDRWGVMWHGAGTVAVDGGTRINTQRATFLDKGQQVGITVDGSHGARLTSRQGIILQTMENDDPGPVMVDGNLVNEGVYTEPATAATRDATFDVTAAHGTDAVASFSHIALTGDIWNGMRGDLNNVLTFDGSTITGVISASTTKHHVSTITSANYQQLGVVTNTAAPVLNNGVIVSLTGGSVWTVTGTSYLSKLTVAAGSAVRGSHLSATVDGVATTIQPGHTYAGNIVLTVR